MIATQPDLFKASIADKFDAWRQTPGGKHILNLCYRRAAGYANRYLKTGRRVSVKLVVELVRDHVSYHSDKLKRRQIKAAKVDGYAINNSFTASIARHIIDHNPEWNGCFELREVGIVRTRRKVIVIDQPISR